MMARRNFLDSDQRQPASPGTVSQATLLPYSLFPDLFEAQVQQTPDAVAVVFDDYCLTYHALLQHVYQLIGYLQSLSLKREAIIGIYMDRSLEMVIALLAALLSGTAYVPLDPSYPRERLASILAEAQIQLLLTQSHFTEALCNYSIPLLVVSNGEKMAEWEGKLSSQRNLHPQQLAYVIFTSGSTGKPKGVAISHAALANLLLSLDPAPRYVQNQDRGIRRNSIYFALFLILSWRCCR